MKKLAVIMVGLVLSLTVLPGCVSSSPQEEITETPVGVRKQHDTRVFIVCKTDSGEYTEKSLHISQSVTCGGSKFKLKDFVKLHTTDRYIAFPGHENELEEYLLRIEQASR